MRKWQDLAAPDDPGSWYSVRNMWPTKRGTYETADFSTGTAVSASSAGQILYAFAGKTLSGAREYVIDETHIWEYSGGSLTDRTNGVTVGGLGKPMMAMYGNVTICVMGNAIATVSSTGGNFSALAGAPQAEIVVVQSNAVVCFNTNTDNDGWHASDVGDYTNWTTGESASGRIITTPGPIIGAVVFGNDILVFKTSAIYRMTYVGDAVKWQIQLVWNGMGLASANQANCPGKYQVVACREGVAFNAYSEAILSGFHATSTANIYLFDGSSPPIPLNPLTTIIAPLPVFTYHPTEDVLVLSPARGANDGESIPTGVSDPTVTTSRYHYYSFQSRAWGHGGGGASEIAGFAALEAWNGVLQGDYYARAEASVKPVYWANKDADEHYRCAPSTMPEGTSSLVACSLETTKLGLSEQKTLYDEVIPLLRRRTDLGTDSVTLNVYLFRELEDSTAASSQSATESTYRKRFNFQASDNFARFMALWTALDVEVDDFKIPNKYGGKN